MQYFNRPRHLTESEILEKTEEIFGSKPRWHSYLAVPAKDCFTTYLETQIDFAGADFYASNKTYTLNIYINYKNEIKFADKEKEEKFEQAMLPMGHYTKECTYNSQYKCFVTHYSFFMSELIKEQEE